MLPLSVFGQNTWGSDQKLFQERALSNYESFAIGDIVNIYLEVDTAFENEADGKIICSPTLSNDPIYLWTFDPKKDIKLKGELIRKTILRDSTSVEFSLRLLKVINTRQANGFWGQVGDTTTTEILYMKLD